VEPAGLGGPTVAGSNRETNGDRKFFEDYADAQGDAVTNGTQISGRKGIGSAGRTRTYNPSVNSTTLPAASRCKHKTWTRDQSVFAGNWGTLGDSYVA